MHTWEIDVYHGALDGLITAECEVKSRDEADLLERPTWFDRSGATNVTHDRAYKNFSLAINGKPVVE